MAKQCKSFSSLFPSFLLLLPSFCSPHPLFSDYRLDFNTTVYGKLETVSVKLALDHDHRDEVRRFCDWHYIGDRDCASLEIEVGAAVLKARDGRASDLVPRAKAMLRRRGASPQDTVDAAALFSEAIRYARSPPWPGPPPLPGHHASTDKDNEVVARVHVARFNSLVRAFHGQRELALRENVVALRDIWQGGDQAWKEHGLTLPDVVKTTPRGDLERRGSPFFAHISKLLHDAEQISNLINKGEQLVTQIRDTCTRTSRSCTSRGS